jgi:phosphoribosylamine---glycine ligase
MNILVIGSGGREHALCWKIAQSPLVAQIYCAPGNAGTAMHARNVEIAANDIEGLVHFAKAQHIDLVVVGPEEPLVHGIVDRMTESDIMAFGPTRAAARLEGSKAFTKYILEKYNIPTAKTKTFTDFKEAQAYAASIETPLVLKADGLAAGKGVLICETRKDVEDGLRKLMVDKVFGAAGDQILVEEFLKGEEATILALTDGEAVVPMVTSQDHKRVFDNDQGPNTGGMGAYSPAPVVTPALNEQIIETIIKPTIHAMAKEGAPYQGVLYAGLMIHRGKAKVLEFNTRLGDPEAQAVLIRMKSDIVPLLLASVRGTMAKRSIEWDERPAVCVVMASGGYPGSYKKNVPIRGLDEVREDDAFVFHAGTRPLDEDIVTSGGRVLGVTALGSDIPDAIAKAYAAVSRIHFNDMHFRHDIGAKAMKK